jgi:hypothetical protein
MEYLERPEVIEEEEEPYERSFESYYEEPAPRQYFPSQGRFPLVAAIAVFALFVVVIFFIIRGLSIEPVQQPIFQPPVYQATQAPVLIPPTSSEVIIVTLPAYPPSLEPLIVPTSVLP